MGAVAVQSRLISSYKLSAFFSPSGKSKCHLEHPAACPHHPTPQGVSGFQPVQVSVDRKSSRVLAVAVALIRRGPVGSHFEECILVNLASDNNLFYSFLMLSYSISF